MTYELELEEIYLPIFENQPNTLFGPFDAYVEYSLEWHPQEIEEAAGAPVISVHEGYTPTIEYVALYDADGEPFDLTNSGHPAAIKLWMLAEEAAEAEITSGKFDL